VSRLLLGLMLAELVFVVFGSLPGAARADVVTEPRVTTISTTPATVPPSTAPSATGTTVAPTATAASTAEAAGGMSPGTVALICVIAVVVVAIGSVFIWRGRAKGHAARPRNR
jgi:hypothetical protein